MSKSRQIIPFARYYERIVRDVAWGGIPVVIRFTARRFVCVNAACPQQIFCERIPELFPAYGRRTVRFTKTIAALGRATSAEATAAAISPRRGNN